MNPTFTTQRPFQNAKLTYTEEVPLPMPKPFSNNSTLNHEHVPTLHADLDQSRSIEFCAFRVDNMGAFQHSFYNHWEADAEDAEEKNILDNLFGTNARPKGLGIINDEGLVSQSMDFGANDGAYPFKDNQDDSEISQYQLQRPLWQGIEAQLYKNLLEKYLEKRETGDKNTQMDNGLWIYNTNNANNVKEEEQEKNGTSCLNLNAGNRRNNQISEPQRDDDRNSPNVTKTQNTSSRITKIVDDSSPSIRFNVMVVGESGLGKSTFIDCFLERKYNSRTYIRAFTKEIKEKGGVREYEGISFKLNFIDTVGYHYDTDMRRWYNNIKGYMKKQVNEFYADQNNFTQFENFKVEKSKRSGKSIFEAGNPKDKKVHVILYFISGPRLKESDLFYMKKLQKYSNIIPVVAKGDSYTAEEVQAIKLELLDQAKKNQIEFFDFEDALKDEPHKLKQLKEGKFGPCPPFLVISSVKKIEISPDKYIYGREYTWGICNIEDPNHSDFVLLQTLLGGYICFQAITYTNYLYKSYIAKKKTKMVKKEEKKKNLTMGTLCAVGLLSALMVAKERLIF